MAYIIITSPDSKLHKVVFRNLPHASAVSIAKHMNELNALAAKTTGNAIRFIYKVIGK